MQFTQQTMALMVRSGSIPERRALGGCLGYNIGRKRLWLSWAEVWYLSDNDCLRDEWKIYRHPLESYSGPWDVHRCAYEQYKLRQRQMELEYEKFKLFVTTPSVRTVFENSVRVFPNIGKEELLLLACRHAYLQHEKQKTFDEKAFQLELVSIYDTETARTVLRGFYAERFELSVDFSTAQLSDNGQFPNVTHGQAYGLEHVAYGFRTALMHGLGVMKIGKGITVNWLWSMAEKAFYSCLGSYYDALKRTAGWIVDVWARMKEWGNEVVASSAQWFSGLQECLVMGLGIIGISAVLVLIEKFMVSSKILSSPIKLAETFITCYIGYIGLREGGSLMKENASWMIGRLIGSCKNVVQAVSVAMQADGVDVSTNEGQFAPLTYLEVFANSLQNLSSEKVVQTGRFFNAFSQIKSGLSAVWECVEKVCSFLFDLLDKGFGIRSRALADLSVMLGKDVQGWLRKCDAACDHMVRFTSVPQDILKNFRSLYAQGQDIRSALLSRTERGSMAALTSVGKALEKLQQLLNAAILAGSSGPRYEPLWIAFVGRAGVGKSTVATTLAGRWLSDQGLSKDDYYVRNVTDPFWSKYRRQPILMYDDLGALTNGTTINEEAELIKLVSRDAVALNMADVAEKGMYFDSSLIITSSNFMNYSPMAVIHDSGAYQRRRGMLIEVHEREGAVRDPKNPVAHQCYTLHNPKGDFEILERADTFEDLYAKFIDKHRMHTETQKEIMASLAIPEKSFKSSIQTVANLLACLQPVVPISFQCYLKEVWPEYNLIACYDGVMYLVDLNLNLRMVTDFEEDVDACDIVRTHEDALTIAVRFTDLLRALPNLSPVAAHYMSLLIEKQVYTKDLKIRRGAISGDPELGEAADGLAMWQRAYVYVLSCSMSEGGKGIFSSIYDAMCCGLQRVYLADVSRWPLSVKLGLGVMAMLIFGGTVFKTLQYLGNFGGGAAFSFAAVKAFSCGQSDDEVRKKTSEYRHRNNPIQMRHWSKGQNDMGITYEWLMKNCLANLKFGHLNCQVVMLPGKRLVGVHHFLHRIPDRVILEVSLDEQLYHISWHADCLKQCENSELSVYQHPTLRDVPRSLGDRLQFGLEHLPDTFGAVLATCKYDDFEKNYVSEVAEITVYKKNNMMTVVNGDYQRIVPAYLEYDAPTVNGDCGALVIAKINGIDRVVGVHVAGTGKRGQSCLLPNELNKTLGQNWFEDDFKSFEHVEPHGNGTTIVGVLKDEKKFFTQQKTAYTHTPESWHLHTECTKEPAILTKFDARIAGTSLAGYDPYMQGMQKYEQECGPFHESTLREVCDEIQETWHDCCGGFDFEETTLEDAINGVPGVDYMDPLVMNTSEGYPYILSRNHNKGKSRFLVEQDGKLMPNEELQRGIDRIEEESATGDVVLVGVECAKDEKLPRKKIYEKPKTRLFTVLPMDYNIVVRRKFFPFVRFLMKKRDCLPCQVGINPYGREWDRVANHLLNQGNEILCCDYSRFDGILPKNVMFQIARIINKTMGGSERLCTQRLNLLMACCGRYGICAGRVWRVENGIPSGFPLTVIINSIFNEVIIRYIYRTIFYDDELQKSLFGKYIHMVVYGDDNLISVSPTISMVFNGEAVQMLAAELNISITDGVDKYKDKLEFRPLEECDFLKRKFVKTKEGLWRGPMELESLWSQLHWVKTKFLGMHEAYLVNVESVLRELYIHDPVLCAQFRNRVLSVSWVKPQHVPTVKQIEAFHSMQLYGEKEFACYAYDALLNPTMLGPIGSVEKDNRLFQFKNLAAVVSGSYKYEENDFVVCLRVQSKYGENGMYVDFSTVSGRGELPTAAWLRENFLRKGSEIFKRLVCLYKVGRRIVFLGRNDNVAPTVILVLFGMAADIVRVDESNIILSRAISVVSSLGYLVDVFPEAFASKDKVQATTYSSMKSWKVFGAGEYEMNLVRRFSQYRNFERRAEKIPHFVDPKDLLEHMIKISNMGMVVESYIKIPELGGLPGFSWSNWIHFNRCHTYEAQFGFRVVLYDRRNVEIFDESVEGILKPGGVFGKNFIYEGKPMELYSFQEKEIFHPLARIVRMIQELLEKGSL